MNTTPLNPQNTRLGWIGTGIMGAPMAGHLRQAGFEVAVYNRTKSRAAKLIEAGCTWCDSPAKLARQSDVVFTILGFPQDVETVYFGEQGLFSALPTDAVLVDMTTTRPALAARIAETAAAQSCSALDAPVSGGQAGAENASLSIMVGGERAVCERLMPLFELLGKNIQYQGPAGAGQHAKLCNQIVVAGNMIGACEALLYGSRAGLDLNTLLASISKGAAASWNLDNLAPRMVKGDFEPGFIVDHFIKDLGLALEEAERMGIALPGVALAKQLYERVTELGYGEKGTQVLYRALQEINARPS